MLHYCDTKTDIVRPTMSYCVLSEMFSCICVKAGLMHVFERLLLVKIVCSTNTYTRQFFHNSSYKHRCVQCIFNNPQLQRPTFSCYNISFSRATVDAMGFISSVSAQSRLACSFFRDFKDKVYSTVSSEAKALARLLSL